MSLWTQKTVNLDPSFDLHGNFLSIAKKVCNCPYKTHFVKVSGKFYNVGFLGSGQNRRRHMAMSILYPWNAKNTGSRCKNVPNTIDWKPIYPKFCGIKLLPGDVYFVRFLRIQLYKITRKLLQNVFCRDSCTFFAMDKKFPWRSKLGSKLTVFWVHKDMSKSYREGIDQKLKTMAFPYKMKGWQKSDKLCIIML